MPKLVKFPTAVQADANSCWACAARMIINFYDNKETYSSDQALADAWDREKPNKNHNKINIQQSASKALTDLKYVNNTDDAPIPSQDEIKAEIQEGHPLLAIVGDAPLAQANQPNLEATDGHWIVIVGISDDKSTIDVFDPAYGNVQSVAYNSSTYIRGKYWQNTSYVDPK